MEEERHEQDHLEREGSSGNEGGAEQQISGALIDALVERVVEKVREQLAPPPSRIPAISSASSGSSEGMSIRIFEHCVPGKRLQCIGYVHLQGADVREGRDTNIYFFCKKMRMYGQKLTRGRFCLSGIFGCCIYILLGNGQGKGLVLHVRLMV